MADVLDTNTPPVVPPVIPSRESGKKTTCVFCGCTMTGDGQDIWHMGEQAKKFQKMNETLAGKDEEIARLEKELADVRKQLAAVEAPGSAESHPLRLRIKK